jgi:hypothetical protein
MTKQELNKIVAAHALWLENKGGNKANLRRANLRGADLRWADLSGANLSMANLSEANLSRANLRGANLSGANLSRANLRGANLSGADLSSTKGLFNPIEWFNKTFEKTDKGYIVYKGFGNTTYPTPLYWELKAGSFIEEICNPLPTNDCACGVNFATKEWVKKNYGNSVIWECLLHFEDLMTLVVPYNTDGKCRCSRLQLVKQLS